jgi:tRNA threonylcarbamoyladenosine biosynthesis protein TsaB
VSALDASAVVVALETSARPASVAVRRGERSAFARLAPDRPHASDLLATLDRLLSEVGAAPSDASAQPHIGAVIVGTGPGSYTGLRVGIATALGLSRGSGAVLAGVPSGETTAFAELAPGREAIALLDARQGELYYAHYRRTADEVEIVRAPCVVTAAELSGILPDVIPIFGDEAAADAARLTSEQRSRLVREASPRADALLTLGAARLVRIGPQQPSSIEPLYLRPFAARQRKR